LYDSAGITDDTKLEGLPLEALRPDQKILPENRLLKNDETTRVLRYYNFIDGLFLAMDRDDTGDFDLIAFEIEVAYKKLDNGQLSQDEIVYSMQAEQLSALQGKLSDFKRQKSRLLSVRSHQETGIYRYGQGRIIYTESPEDYGEHKGAVA